MLEIVQLTYEIIGCFGTVDALDRLAEESDLAIRVASDELLLFRRPGQFAEIDSDACDLTLDLSSGCSIWGLRGDNREEAFRRLSALKLPQACGVLQGLVAQLPAKVIVREDEILVMTPAPVAHHLRARLLAACADLAPAERAGAVLSGEITV